LQSVDLIPAHTNHIIRRYHPNPNSISHSSHQNIEKQANKLAGILFLSFATIRKHAHDIF